MEKKTIELSISLLSSGRIATIERSLRSLQAFRKYLNTEIIVVDTDPDKRQDVAAIVKRYADKVIPFVWCDDFSAARNTGIKACSGKWFMVFDDDEWIEDVGPIVDFLKSDESEDYEWVRTRIRNYVNHAFTDYADSWMTRLIRLHPDTQYVGKVHEYLSPRIGKPKDIDSYSYHTGYIYDNEEERKRHIWRNLKPLEELVKEEPGNMRWHHQILVEYGGLDDYEKQGEVCRNALKLLEDQTGEQAMRYRGLFAACLLRIDRKSNQWEAARETYERLKDYGEYADIARANMEIEAAQLYFRLGDETESRRHCVAYLDYYDHRDEETDRNFTDYFLPETYEPHMSSLIISMLLYYDLKAGKWDSFDAYFGKVTDDRYLGEIVEAVVSGTEQGTLTGVDSRISFRRWRRCVDSYLQGDKGKNKEKLGEVLKWRKSRDREEAPHYAYLTYRFGYRLAQLVTGSDMSYETMRELLQECEKSCLTHYRAAGIREELLAENSELLPDECRLSVALSRILYQPENEWRSVLIGLKEAIGLYPDMDDCITEHSHLYADHIKELLFGQQTEGKQRTE